MLTFWFACDIMNKTGDNLPDKSEVGIIKNHILLYDCIINWRNTMSEIKCSLENEGFLAHYYQGNKEKNKAIISVGGA